MALKEKIIEKLKQEIDPGTGMDVVSMGIIRELQATPEGRVSFQFCPSSSVCPLVFSLALKVQKAVKKIEEVKDLKITVVDHTMSEEVNRYLQDEGEETK